MTSSVTLILILHNRHKNLARLLEFYKDFSSPIIIADSSSEKYKLNEERYKVQHLYTPGYSFTKKIENALSIVKTPFVVMCADDDFIIVNSIYKCVAFLEANNDYTIAQGMAIQYKKDSITTSKIELGLLYRNNIVYDVENGEPFKRLQNFFKNYRSVLYAVHRTDILSIAYRNAGNIVNNLYLNEYLSAIVPIIAGKYKELSILYQVREYADDSDDKTTPNLDKIFSRIEYKTELHKFIELATINIFPVYTAPKEEISNELIRQLLIFSKSPLIGENKRPVSKKKQLGLLIQSIPFFGKWLIHINRKIERKKQLKEIYKSDEENNLNAINILLKKYANK
jgi:glycosyltransferase domain-containing protein